jgi:membrane-associated protein
MQLIDFILHCNEYIGTFIADYGSLIYGLLFIIVFCETGLVFLPFLPGDSLIFAAGAFAAIGKMNIFLLIILLIIAAVVGDSINYSIGKKFGKIILDSGKFKMIKKENVDKANALIAKYGGAAVFIARFMPIIRTMVPFLVGMGKLEYKSFIKFNALGGIIWVTLFALIGYFFGNIPAVQDHFTLILLSIIFISLLPMIIGIINAKIKKMKVS